MVLHLARLLMSRTLLLPIARVGLEPEVPPPCPTAGISSYPFRKISPPSLRGNENDTVSSVIDRKQGISPPTPYPSGRTGTLPLADLPPPMKHRVSKVRTSLPIHLARDSATSLALTIIGDSAGILGRRIPSFSKQSLLSFLSRDRPSRPPVPKG